MTHAITRHRRRVAGRCALLSVSLAAFVAPTAGLAATARERAIEQIPELMGRILESQEEIRERENEMAPVVQRYDRDLIGAKRAIESASTEELPMPAI